MRAIVLATALVLLTGVAGAAQLDDFNSDSWVGAAYTDDSSGQLDRCSASAPFARGTSMTVTITRDLSWTLSLSNPKWHLPVGRDYPIRLMFDGAPPIRTASNAKTSSLLEITMPAEATLISLFRDAHILSVKSGSFDEQFSLTGTSDLVSRLAQCVGDHVTAEAVATPSTAVPSSSAEETSPPPSASSAEPLPDTASSVAIAAAPGEARGQGDVFTGTGFIVSTDADVLTNNHVIEQCSNIVVRRSGEPPEAAQLLFTDPANDLALLRIGPAKSQSEVARLRADPIRAGEEVAIYGYPLIGTLSEAGNIVGGNVSALAGLGDDVRFVQITAPTQPGNSGGPLMDMTGRVIGVVNMKLDEMKLAAGTGDFPQNVNFAIKGNVAENFLEAHHIRGVTARGTEPAMPLTDIADLARLFTVLIVCE